MDPREAEERVREAEYLKRRRCPHSGLDLRLEVRDGWGLPPGFMCAVCDCFGYRPEEVG